MNKVALIFGITGQDGSYLTKYLQKKGYKIIGVSRFKRKNISNFNKLNINKKKIKIFKLNILNQKNIYKIIFKSNCSKIFFLSGITSIEYSFKNSIKTLKYNIKYIFYILEACKKINKNIKIYNSLSSECFGYQEKKINENSRFAPYSPYGLSKSISYYLTKYYRDTHKMWISNGYLFNHESPLRPDNYVIKKIIKEIKLLKNKKSKKLKVGNVNIYRDWGWAPEFIEYIYKITELKKSDDFIIATGRTTKLKDLIIFLFKRFNVKIKNRIQIDRKLFRKNEIKKNFADVTKLKNKFNSKPNMQIFSILEKMSSNTYY